MFLSLRSLAKPFDKVRTVHVFARSFDVVEPFCESSTLCIVPVLFGAQSDLRSTGGKLDSQANFRAIQPTFKS